MSQTVKSKKIQQNLDPFMSGFNNGIASMFDISNDLQTIINEHTNSVDDVPVSYKIPAKLLTQEHQKKLLEIGYEIVDDNFVINYFTKQSKNNEVDDMANISSNLKILIGLFCLHFVVIYFIFSL